MTAETTQGGGQSAEVVALVEALPHDGLACPFCGEGNDFDQVGLRMHFFRWCDGFNAASDDETWAAHLATLEGSQHLSSDGEGRHAGAEGDEVRPTELQSNGEVVLKSTTGGGEPPCSPEPPWPIGTVANCKRHGWNAYFEGVPRSKCPFPPARNDLKLGFEEGWDAADKHKRGETP